MATLQGSPINLNLTRHAFTLPGGLRVVLYERPDAPIYLEAVFDCGSRRDKGIYSGEAHFLEHLLVAGTESFPSKDAIARTIEPFGGWAGGATSSDWLRLKFMVGTAEHFPRVATLLQEIIGKPRFDSQVFHKERGSILQEIRNFRSNPQKYIYEPWRRSVFAGTPLQNSVLGKPEELEAWNLEDMKSFYHDTFLTSSMTLLIAGGIRPAQITEQLGSALAGLSLTSHGIAQEEPPASNNSQVVAEHTAENNNVSLRLTLRLPAMWDRDLATAHVIKTILAGGRGSRLTVRLRYEKGLVYSVSSFHHNFPGGSVLVVDTECAPDDIREVHRTIKEELASLAAIVDDEEVDLAKAKIVNTLPVHLQGVEKIVEYARQADLLTGEGYDFEKRVSEIQSVTAPDIRSWLNRYAKEENRYLTLCGDTPKGFESFTS